MLLDIEMKNKYKNINKKLIELNNFKIKLEIYLLELISIKKSKNK